MLVPVYERIIHAPPAQNPHPVIQDPLRVIPRAVSIAAEIFPAQTGPELKLTSASGIKVTGSFTNGIPNDGLVKISFPDKIIYRGTIRNKEASGSNGIFQLELPVYQYHGEFLRGTFNGRGKIFSKDTYEGSFSNGNYDGQGHLKCSNGDEYLGQFAAGVFTLGRVKITFNGDKYEGEYSDGKANGKGKLIYKNGDVYEGEFQDGGRHGIGKLKSNSGDYEGKWENDFKQGMGTQTWSNGDIYTGEWYLDRQQGDGMMTFTGREGSIFPAGSELKGYWISGNIKRGSLSQPSETCFKWLFFSALFQTARRTLSDGSSNTGKVVEEIGEEKRIKYSDGATLRVKFVNFKAEGIGFYTFADGDTFEGEFVQGQLQQGLLTTGTKRYMGKVVKGIFEIVDGYIGEFKESKYHGSGALISSSGEVYEGNWSNGNKDGFGCQTYNNGDRYEGDWFDNFRHGKGTYTWKNGATYEGDFFQNNSHGTGMLLSANSKTLYIGQWVNDAKEGTGIEVKLGSVVGHLYLCKEHFLVSELDGRGYKGKVIKTHPNGKKTVTYSDRTQLTAFFQDGKAEGLGHLTYPNGKETNVQYAEGKALGKFISSPGVAYFAYNDHAFCFENIYEGGFSKGQYHGQGSYTFSNGNLFIGTWVHGKSKTFSEFCTTRAALLQTKGKHLEAATARVDSLIASVCTSIVFPVAIGIGIYSAVKRSEREELNEKMASLRKKMQVLNPKISYH